MTRSNDRCHRWRTVALIWTFAAFLFYLGFRMALDNSKSTFPTLAEEGSSMSISDQRTALYDRMEKDLDEKGPVFLRGVTSQTLSLSDMFELKDGDVVPILKAVSPPVRANVLYISPQYSVHIAQVIRDIFLPYFEKAVWFQNQSLYHSSMFHASHHVTTVFATDAEVEAEANAVKSVSDALCPLKAVLDRVILTSTGVLLGCWQVSSGSDPLVIRSKLRNALPRAPHKQLYDPVIFHTSLARLLGRPNIQLKEPDELKFFHDLVARVNNTLHGYQIIIRIIIAAIDMVMGCKNDLYTGRLQLHSSKLEVIITELWFVEEFDVLALALDGKMRIHKFNLGCASNSHS